MELLEAIKREYLIKGNSVPKLSKRFGLSEDFIYDLMVKHNIPRRNFTEANYYLHKDRAFKIKENLSGHDERLKIAGVMLYWAEGSKASLKASTVDFANSDPEMIKLFLTFLRKLCGVHEGRLRIFLYTYRRGQNIEKLKAFWSSVTRIPETQFTKPYLRQGNLNKSGRKMLYGLVHIRYADKRLLLLLLKWIKEIKDSFLGRYPSGQRGQTVTSSAQ